MLRTADRWIHHTRGEASTIERSSKSHEERTNLALKPTLQLDVHHGHQVFPRHIRPLSRFFGPIFLVHLHGSSFLLPHLSGSLPFHRSSFLLFHLITHDVLSALLVRHFPQATHFDLLFGVNDAVGELA